MTLILDFDTSTKRQYQVRLGNLLDLFTKCNENDEIKNTTRCAWWQWWQGRRLCTGRGKKRKLFLSIFAKIYWIILELIMPKKLNIYCGPPQSIFLNPKGSNYFLRSHCSLSELAGPNLVSNILSSKFHQSKTCNKNIEHQQLI